MRRALHWCVPPLLAMVIYWPGLTCWFQKDDFAWLGLYDMIHSWSDFWTAMFHPYAQGTIRTLSERVFYTSFFALFGMHPLPYRIWAFATYVADLTLVSLVCTRLTGSQAAGFWSAILWTANGAMAVALAWTAIYYELLCALFFLLGLWLLMRYAETRERRYLVAQWTIYMVGFGVLEQNVMYPALAVAYALCCARHVLRQALPMFVPAVLYTALHIWSAPLSSAGPYRMHWGSVFPVLWTYWKIALGPSKLILLHVYPSRSRSGLTALLTAALLCFLVRKMQHREWVTLFFAGWFVIVLAPLLPLLDHVSEYYLTIPLAGLAMWGAWALVSAWRAGLAGRATAMAALVVYVCVGIPLARVTVVSFHIRGEKIQSMIAGVVEQSRLHPGNPVVLTGVEPDIFWSALYHRPFRLYGIDEVHIAPENRAAIQTDQAEQLPGELFRIPPNARIYDVSGGKVTEILGQ